MGGEKGLLPGTGCKGLGSPPHGRGKADVLFTHFLAWRITPAWAGKRLPLPDIAAQTQDHPRVGGEKARTLIVQDEPQGSPPHGRGKGDPGMYDLRWMGITPAWAGKRIAGTQQKKTAMDHPRVGGEKMLNLHKTVPL